MGNNLHEIFKSASYQPESRLSADVWSAIEARSAKRAKIKTFGYSLVGIVSLFGSILSIRSLISESIKLGFYNYFSLIFRDGGILATYWREYTLTLVDSLPIATLGLSLALLFVLFISIRNVSYSLKIKY